MTALSTRALTFAALAHRGQVRRYTGEPYFLHPIEVANIVRSVPHTEEMVAAAYLHGVVEDTPVTLAQIEAAFGQAVAELVGWLTDVSKPEDGNRATRKQLDLEHTAKAPRGAKTIKLADCISNSRSISAHDPNFWRVYRREIGRLLAVMKEGDPTLWERAAAQLEPTALPSTL